MDSPATGSGIGQPVRRREDLRLVRGNGRYTADENLPGQVYAVMLRSPHAHARIRSIATDKAKDVPGVIAIFTGADCLAGGLKPIPHIPWSPHQAEAVLRLKNGETPFEAPHHALPTDKARFVGEAVAMVVAETVYAAKNGAEQVEVDYEALPAVVDTVPAARQDAPRVHDSARSNVCFDSDLGDFDATEAAFARAAHVTRFETWVQRVTGVPMEPRAALAAFDTATSRYTVYAGNGGAVRLKNDLAKMLDVPPEQVRVLMQDVGGNFGTRGMIYAEFALIAWAAKRVGRPVKWIIERHEVVLVRLSGPRPRRRSRACARRQRPFPGDARLQSRQSRRPHHEFRDGAKGRADDVEHLSGAGGLFPRSRHAQPYFADTALSQRRPPGGDLCDGAADRSRCARVRL